MVQEGMAVAKNLFIGGGEMGALMRSYDWSKTPFGDVEQWPQSLRSALSICLNSRFPIAIYWGPDCLLLYNDAWRPIVGDKHPWSIGRPGREVWPEIWNEIGPEFESVFATGEGIFHSDELLAMHRFGYTEECFFDYTFNPIQGEGGRVDGIINIVSETTYRVLNDRRTRLLREVASKPGTAKTVEEACTLMTELLRAAPADIPFSLLYLIDRDGKQARLCNSAEITLDHAIAPVIVNLDGEDNSDNWAIAQVARTGQSQVITNLVARVGTLPGSPWAEPPEEAMVLPIATTEQSKVLGVLVAVASPRRRLDEHYRDFFGQIARQIATTIVNARSYEDERRRAEQLAELDRAKTVFFSNVSHEFRTPLTLMLGPVEDALQDTQDAAQRDRLELIHRNALRLQKLVNTLLDFSRIEAGRIEAVYEPTDLAMLTTDLVGVFRAAIERAGLRLRVDCPPLPEPIYVDREMWEKIILNLLSNAFKFTLEGEIAVVLRFCDDHIELDIQDNGTGIPAAELPHIFERFHRVQGARGRTYEGSGIGLSLVQELVRLQGGTIEVSSVVDQGTRFTLSIPTGYAHLPSDRLQSESQPIPATRILASTATGVISYVEEALRWLPEQELGSPILEVGLKNADPALETTQQQQSGTLQSDTRQSDTRQSDTRQSDTRQSDKSQPIIQKPTFKILVADDNADMRDYVKRLLSQQYDVETVRDGVAALAAVRRQPPDLVLTDVMMPEMDGFELLQSLRSDPATQDIPIILLSARAGEKARIEGLEAGADDYLTKPFSARELLARVEASLKLSLLRQEASQNEQALRVEVQIAKDNLEKVLARITDQFLALDREWRYTYLNARVVEVTGTARENLLGQCIWDLFPDLVGTQFYTEVHRAVIEQTPVQFEYFYPLLNRWFENHVHPSTDGVSIIVTDITDRKQAEETLQQAHRTLRQQATQLEQTNAILQNTLADLQTAEEELRQQNEELVIARERAEQEGYRYQDLFNFAPNGYVVTDANGIIQEANRAIAALVEVEQLHLVNTPLISYISQFDHRAFRNLLYELYQPSGVQKLQTDELSLHRRGRPPIPVAITGTAIYNAQTQIVGVRWLIRDITDRKQAEENLRESEARHRAIVNQAIAGVAHSDPGGKLTLVNQKYCEITGYSAAELSQLQMHEITHPEDLPRNLELYNRMIADGTPFQIEKRYIRKDGTIVWVNNSVSVICDRNGNLQSVVAIVLDVTERKRAEAERDHLLSRERAAREEAETANRVKDEFLAVLSHELRSPLNPILGWSTLLLNNKLDAARTTQALTTIQRNAKLQSELIEDLLDVSRILQGKLSLNVAPVNLVSTIQSALETVRLAAEAKSIDLQFTISDFGLENTSRSNASSVAAQNPIQHPTFQVSGDSTRLQQVIWNLLSNAVKFTPPQGRVNIQVERLDSYACITVSDSGQGIAPDFLPYVFDYFRQANAATTRKFGGLGLGLAIARHLVELHGGTIEVESPGEGQGAAFTVQLPLMSSEPSPNPRTGAPELALDLTGIRVLVVDDDHDAREFVTFLIEQHGATVIPATSAGEALVALTRLQPNVLLSDIGMPDVDGYMLMRHVRALPPEQGGQIPAIALTAYAGEIDHQQAMSVGFQRHIPKPVEPATLIEAIMSLIEQRESNPHPHQM